MSEQIPGALDKLVRSNPSQIANFALSSNVVRHSILSAGESLLLLPERGAMPIYWAADGLPSEEGRVTRDGVIALPVGSYDFENLDGQLRKGTLSRQQKQKIVARHTADIIEAPRVMVLDEVQKGGTITEMTEIVQGIRRESTGRLFVVAAQDTRRKVAAEAKNKKYEALASNSKQGVSATVIPMPLTSTDSDVLLNQLWYNGHTRVPEEADPEIAIHPNEEAEIIFRALGMAARNREALEDTSVFDKAIFEYPVGRKASFRIEAWRERLLETLRDKAS